MYIIFGYVNLFHTICVCFLVYKHTSTPPITGNCQLVLQISPIPMLYKIDHHTLAPKQTPNQNEAILSIAHLQTQNFISVPPKTL